MKILVKISGDLVENEEIIQLVNGMYPSCVIHGCGRQISSALKKKGIPFKFKNGIRKTTQKGLKICFSVCNKIRRKFLQKIDCNNIISPVVLIGGKIVNTNADQIYRNAIKSHDCGVIFTKSERRKCL